MIVETNLPDLKIKINQIIPFWKSKVTVISAKLPDGGRCPPYNVALSLRHGQKIVIFPQEKAAGIGLFIKLLVMKLSYC